MAEWAHICIKSLPGIYLNEWKEPQIKEADFIYTEIRVEPQPHTLNYQA